MLKLLYEWLVLAPADLVAYAVLLPMGIAPFFATAAAWYYSAWLLDGERNFRPTKASTFLIAGLISVYVFFVTGTALVRLPHVAWQIMKDDD